MNQLQRPLSEWVLDAPAAARVLWHHGLDFCCGGQRPFDEACRARGLDPTAVAHEVEAAEAEASTCPDDPRGWSDAQLDAWLRADHVRIAGRLPDTGAMVDKVARVHGDRDPRLAAVATSWHGLVDALTPHFAHEEAELLPALLGGPLDAEGRAELTRTVSEHEQVGGALKHLRALTDGYVAPDWACGTYRAMLANLAELETALLAHVHLENHVLAPRLEARR
jgi:regulator of cell morphogenesis and NO signaling